MPHPSSADAHTSASSYPVGLSKWLLIPLAFVSALPIGFLIGWAASARLGHFPIRVGWTAPTQNTQTQDTQTQRAQDTTPQSAPAPTLKPSPRPNTAALGALKALRKLNSATEAGVSFRQYGPLVVDAKAEVDEALRELSDEKLEAELRLAIQAYADALRVWGELLDKDGNHISYTSDVGEMLIKKYRLPVPRYQYSIISDEDLRSEVLTRIWGIASRHTEQGAALLR